MLLQFIPPWSLPKAGLGERLWVGEPGRLSLDDREWWRPEEKLRLVCSTDDCFEIFLKSDFRLGD